MVMPPPAAQSSAAATDDALTARMDEYVKSRGGSQVIRRILIANNGMAATKTIMSIRNWCYNTFGDERAVEFVVMATPEDLAANAEFIRRADEFVEVPGDPGERGCGDGRLGPREREPEARGPAQAAQRGARPRHHLRRPGLRRDAHPRRQDRVDARGAGRRR